MDRELKDQLERQHNFSKPEGEKGKSSQGDDLTKAHLDKFDDEFYKKVDEIANRLHKTNKYGDFKCVEFKNDLVKALKKAKYKGFIVELKSESEFIESNIRFRQGINDPISTNGFHVGVQVGDKVFDNIHKNGLPYNDWINDFEVRPGHNIKISKKEF